MKNKSSSKILNFYLSTKYLVENNFISIFFYLFKDMLKLQCLSYLFFAEINVKKVCLKRYFIYLFIYLWKFYMVYRTITFRYYYIEITLFSTNTMYHYKNFHTLCTKNNFIFVNYLYL